MLAASEPFAFASPAAAPAATRRGTPALSLLIFAPDFKLGGGGTRVDSTAGATGAPETVEDAAGDWNFSRRLSGRLASLARLPTTRAVPKTATRRIAKPASIGPILCRDEAPRSAAFNLRMSEVKDGAFGGGCW